MPLDATQQADTGTDPPDYSDQFNTPLSPADETRYQAWATQRSAVEGRDVSADTFDYDLRGAWKSNAQEAANGHLPDTWKKPNHPTFSTQSQYNGVGGMTGGQWIQNGKEWAYRPSATNLNMHGPDGLREYFKQTEPASTLLMAQPPIRRAGGGSANPTSTDVPEIPEDDETEAQHRAAGRGLPSALTEDQSPTAGGFDGAASVTEPSQSSITIGAVREKYPQYKDLSDQQLAEGLHRKFYADMPFDQFSARIGYQAPKPVEQPSEAAGAGWAQDPVSGAFEPPETAVVLPRPTPSTSGTPIPTERAPPPVGPEFDEFGRPFDTNPRAGPYLTSFARGAVTGTGSAIESVGTAADAIQRDRASRSLASMFAVDTGNPTLAMRDASDAERAGIMSYVRSTPEQRAQMRQGAQDQLAAVTNPPTPNAVTRAGEAVTGYGGRAFATPKNEQNFGTRIAEGAGAMLPMVGAAAAGTAIGGPAGGIVGASAVIGAQSYDATHKEAVQHGMAPEDADHAAAISALTQVGIMALPVGRLIESVPGVASSLWQGVTDMAKRGVEFGSFNSLSKFADNFVARQTGIDPDRNLLEGVPEAGAEGLVMGSVAGIPRVLRSAATPAPPAASGTSAIEGDVLPPTPSAGPSGGPGSPPHEGPTIEDEVIPPEPSPAAPAGSATSVQSDIENARAAVAALREKPVQPSVAPEPPVQAAAPTVAPTPAPAPQPSSTAAAAPTFGEPTPPTQPAQPAQLPKNAMREALGDFEKLESDLFKPGASTAFAEKWGAIPVVQDTHNFRFILRPAAHGESPTMWILGGADEGGAWPVVLSPEVYANRFTENNGRPLVGETHAWFKLESPMGGRPFVVTSPLATREGDHFILDGDRGVISGSGSRQAPIGITKPTKDTTSTLAQRAAAARAQADQETQPQTPAPIIPQPAPAAQPVSNPYVMLDPDQLTLRPDLFQYKASDTRGVTGALLGTNRWEPDLADPITAWESNDGQISPVNGHQRTDLAQRAKAAGQPDVQVPARIFREADGYTPEYMKVLGAYQNIGQGSGTALDAAKVLRGSASVPESMRLPGLPPNQALVQQGRGLAALSNDAFGMVEAGAVQAAHASFVGEAIRDPAQQIAALQVLQKAEPPTAEQARLMVQDIARSGFLQAAEADQGDIFGMGGPPPPTMFAERAKVLSNALKILRGNRAVFGAAVRGEDTLTAAGNALNAQGNVGGKSANDRLIDRLNDDATRRGPLSDSLSVAARDIAAGKPLPAVTSQFLAQVRAIERSGSGASLQSGVAPERTDVAGEAGVGAPRAATQADLAARETAEPTPAQAEAGNYPKGRVSIGGLNISLETPKGAERRGVGPDGQPWSVTMPDHYGYIRRTEGADGDHLDATLGPLADHATEMPVYVVDQYDPHTGAFDEHKTFLGFPDRRAAIASYDASFSDGSGIHRGRGFTAMPFDEFKEWALHGDTTKPVEDVGLAQPSRVPLPPKTGPDLFAASARPETPRPQQAPLIRNDPTQHTIPGTEPSAVQAQAARDAAGPRAGQKAADEGLFKRVEMVQPELPTEAAKPPPAATPKLTPPQMQALKKAARIFRFQGSGAIRELYFHPSVVEKLVRDGMMTKTGGAYGDGLRLTEAGKAAAGVEPQSAPLGRPAPRTSRYPIPTDQLHEAPALGHEAAAQWVAQQGQRTGYEHLAVVDNATGQIIHAGTGSRHNFIPFDPRAIANEPPNSLTVHHNHPSGRSLSVQDLQIMAADPISHVVAVGHNGAVYIASAGPAMKRIVREKGLAAAQSEISSRYAVADRRAEAIVRPLWRSGALDTETANAAWSDLVNRYLNANGTTTYLSSHKLPEAVHAQFTRSLVASPALFDRSTRTVQPTEGIASLPGPVAGAPGGQEAGSGVAANPSAPRSGNAGRGLAEERGVTNPQTETPEFRRWFGASKVVDAEGKPLVVYHGTTGDFDAFDPNRAGANTMHPTSRLGHWFSADPNVANLFTQTVDDSTWPVTLTQQPRAQTMPAYLSIHRPFEMTADQFRELQGRPYGEHFEAEQPEAAKKDRNWFERQRDLLFQRGYDGIHVTGDTKYADRMGGEEYAHDAWVAFRPDQIKSAIGNRGTFDPNNPSILAEDRPPFSAPDLRAATQAAQRALDARVMEAGPRATTDPAVAAARQALASARHDEAQAAPTAAPQTDDLTPELNGRLQPSKPLRQSAFPPPKTGYGPSATRPTLIDQGPPRPPTPPRQAAQPPPGELPIGGVGHNQGPPLPPQEPPEGIFAPPEPPRLPPREAEVAAARITAPAAVKNLNPVEHLTIFPRTLASLDERFGRLYNAWQRRETDTATNVDTLRQVIARTFLKLSRQERLRVAAAMEVGRITPEGLTENPDGTLTARNDTIPFARWSKVGDVIRLTPEQTRAANEAIALGDKQWEMLMQGAARRYGWEGNLDPAAIRAAAQQAGDAGGAKKLGRLADLLDVMRQHQQTIYFPMQRFGSYFIAIRPKEGPDVAAGLGGHPPLAWFETVRRPMLQDILGTATGKTTVQAVAAKRIAELRQQFPADRFDIQQGDFVRNPELLRRLDLPAIQKLFMIMENKVEHGIRDQVMSEEGGPTTAQGIRTEARNRYEALHGATVEAFYDALFHELKAGYRKRASVVPGYDADFDAAMSSHMHQIARNSADMVHRDGIESAYQSVMDRHPNPNVSRYTRDWRQYQEDPTEPMSRAANNLNQIGFAYVMGMSPSSTMVMMSHTPMMAAPVLSVGVGPHIATPALIRGLGRSYRALSFDKQAGAVINYDKAMRGMPPAKVAFLKQMIAEGRMHSLGADDLARLNEKTSQLIGEHIGLFRRGLAIATSNVSAVDSANRFAVASAAYDIGANRASLNAAAAPLMQHNALFREMVQRDGLSAETYGRFMMSQAAMDWGKANRPAYARTWYGTLAASLHGFVARYLSANWNLMKNMGPEGKLAFALSMGALALGAGVQGLPFAQDTENAADYLTKLARGSNPGIGHAIEDGLASVMGKAGAEIVMHGPLSYLTGVDIGSRIGLGNIVTRSFDSANVMGTMPAIVVHSLMNAWERHNTGQPSAAVASELAPFAARGALRAEAELQQGVVSPGGTQSVPPEKIPGADLARTALGFTPMHQAEVMGERSRYYEAQQGISHVQDLIRQGKNDEAGDAMVKMGWGKQRIQEEFRSTLGPPRNAQFNRFEGQRAPP